MADGIHLVTFSEWKLVQRRLDDQENLVKDLKLEILGECKCNRSKSYSENQLSDEEKTETIIGLNTQSTSAASGIIDLAGKSTIQTEEMTLGGRYVSNTAESTPTVSPGSKLNESISVNTTANGNNGTPVSMKATSRLPNGFGILELEKYRRAQVKLMRCDQVEVMGTSSQFRIAINKSKLTSTSGESQISSRKCPVFRRKRNGLRAELTFTPFSLREKRFVCHICSKEFDQKSHLTDHIRIHTGDKPFQCNSCSKSFTQAANLKTHTIVHTGDKPFERSFCSKKFSQKNTLAIHTRVHSGEKPFECGFCSKTFGHKHTLAEHLRSYTGERPFTCQFCSKTFTVRRNMQVRLRVHKREKPYSCPLCSKIFAHRDHLNRHLKTHPGETPQ